MTISDLSSGLTDKALENATAAGVSFVDSVVADARDLAQTPKLYEKGPYDLVLLLGPLYHILEEEEQLRAVISALDMVKPGGHVVIAFVTRNAHLRDVVKSDPERIVMEKETYDEYFKTCRYVRGSGPSMFHWTIKGIEAFFNELIHTAPPFEIFKRVGCEGFLGFRLGANLAHVGQDCFARWMDVIMETARTRQLSERLITSWPCSKSGDASLRKARNDARWMPLRRRSLLLL